MFYRHDEFPAFHVSRTVPCPYLNGRQERKIFTIAADDDALSIYNNLSKQGFRRSQFAFYKPACIGCKACLSVRIPVAEFVPSNSQRRILQFNRQINRTLSEPVADIEQFEVFKSYITERHSDGAMSDMNQEEYEDMVEQTVVRTWLLKYYDNRLHHSNRYPLIAACLTDVLDDGLSMLYSYFDPRWCKNSLGTFMVLDHVNIVKRMGRRFKYVYLGYWIPTSKKMEYKAKFSPLEILRNGEWREMSCPEDYTPDYFPDP